MQGSKHQPVLLYSCTQGKSNHPRELNMMDRDTGQGGAILRKKVLVKGPFSEYLAQDLRGFSTESAGLSALHMQSPVAGALAET